MGSHQPFDRVGVPLDPAQHPGASSVFFARERPEGAAVATPPAGAASPQPAVASPGAAVPGPEGTDASAGAVPDGAGAAGVDADALAAVLNDFAATVTGDFSVDDILRQLGSGITRVLHVDGAGVLTPRSPGGMLRVAFATPGLAESLDRLQEALQEGPCYDCHSTGRLVQLDDPAPGGRWPEFERRAGALGVRSVTAVPMRARGRLWGVLDLYRCAPEPLGAGELAAATMLANLATSYLVVAADRDTARHAQDELAHRATHDPLTDLPTRWMFFEHVTHALAGLARRSGQLGVLFLDLDNLKQVNDTFGHLAGDRLITTAAERVRAALRPTDILARLGGDEFVVLLENLTTATDAELVAQRILDELHVPYRPQGRTINTSASIGIATTGDPAQTADALVLQADSAMYRAKEGGRGRYEVFDPELHAAERARTTAEERLIAELGAALRQDELELHYQPIIEVLPDVTEPARPGAGIYAVEALVRWNHPARGLLPAGAFIDAAVRGGLIGDLGAWVLSAACRQLRAWDETLGDGAPRRMFVNVSTQELTDVTLPLRVADTLAATGLAANRLTLEITESGMITRPEVTLGALAQLRELGVQLAIDDFGTGYSSLSRLTQIPASTLKIDQSFTRDLAANRDAAAVVAAVLLLGHNLRRTVIVEGVEDAETLAGLHELGCTHVQGYYLSTPKQADELVRELTERPWDARRDEEE